MSTEVVEGLSDRGDALPARTSAQGRAADSCAHFASLHDTGEPSVTLCIPPTTTVSPALMPGLTNTRSGRRASTSMPRSAALPPSTTYAKFSSPLRDSPPAQALRRGRHQSQHVATFLFRQVSACGHM